MTRYRLMPRLETLEHRLALSSLTPASIPIVGGTPQGPADHATAGVPPTDPVDAPPAGPPPYGCPIIIAPVPPPDPFAPVLA